jgi:putative heme transporter
MAVDADASALGIEPESGETTPAKLGRLIGWGPKLGLWAWSFVGVVVAVTIVLFAVGAVSEIVLPLTFAAVLAVCFSPMAGGLVRRGLKPSAASGLLVLGLPALGVFVGYSTVHGITQQTAEISSSVDAAIATAVDELDADEESLEAAREAIEGAAPTVGEGFATHLTEGLDKVIGLASGLE